MTKTGTSMLGLLEQLSFQTGCMYLSDLHNPNLLPLIQHAAGKIIPQDYSLWDWEDAVHYITGQKRPFESQAEAAAFLREFYGDNKGGKQP